MSTNPLREAQLWQTQSHSSVEIDTVERGQNRPLKTQVSQSGLTSPAISNSTDGMNEIEERSISPIQVQHHQINICFPAISSVLPHRQQGMGKMNIQESIMSLSIDLCHSDSLLISTSLLQRAKDIEKRHIKKMWCLHWTSPKFLRAPQFWMK